MSRGKRYDTEPKLNMKKVFAVIIAIAVIIMFIFIIKKLLVKDKDTETISSSSYFALYKDNKWGDRKSTRLNSSHSRKSRMPSSA